MNHYKGMVKSYVLWYLLLIALPLFLIVLYSVTTGDNSLLTIHFTLANFKKILDPVYVSVFVKSRHKAESECIRRHVSEHFRMDSVAAYTGMNETVASLK